MLGNDAWVDPSHIARLPWYGPHVWCTSEPSNESPCGITCILASPKSFGERMGKI